VSTTLQIVLDMLPRLITVTTRTAQSYGLFRGANDVLCEAHDDIEMSLREAIIGYRFDTRLMVAIRLYALLDRQEEVNFQRVYQFLKEASGAEELVKHAVSTEEAKHGGHEEEEEEEEEDEDEDEEDPSLERARSSLRSMLEELEKHEREERRKKQERDARQSIERFLVEYRRIDWKAHGRLVTFRNTGVAHIPPQKIDQTFTYGEMTQLMRSVALMSDKLCFFADGTILQAEADMEDFRNRAANAWRMIVGSGSGMLGATI
jgi:predicted component of type VI protein secretion system